MIASTETHHTHPSEKNEHETKKTQGFQFKALCEAEGLDPKNYEI